ncbi:DUF2075 domain-containing protein [Eggerthella sp. YY7918]|uniref:DUF2075 domain-containing protein n=1 Tax=Eggerthella sp. (strain YY7918) TaxID=502558 RepID=UPI00021716C3|nr:DUF2075 domain-containing protein [Eggerthella sp. YY7918]BAK45554.1 hypothetical protein EGYY_24850 [Eggerthella sp. YY7918]
MRTIKTDIVPKEPKGSQFVIERCPFQYGTNIDLTILDLEEDKVLNWPMVYILANSDSAYVGQTTSVATRMGQHGASEEKKDFTTVNIIFNEEFNASVITDYEHRLIGLMHADGIYHLTNKNDGMTDTNYFSKSEYADMFESLWEELRLLELADHTITEIEESEVFKYSPYKGLTTDQRVAIDRIMASIKNGVFNAQPIVVEGRPGTGKTILAIYLLKMLKDDPRYSGMNIRILEPVSQLRETLKKSVANVNGLSEMDIMGPDDLAKAAYGFNEGEKGFDILLVDEAHRLKRRTCISNYGQYDKTSKVLGKGLTDSQLDWVLSQAKLPVLFYDPMQAVGPSCVEKESFDETLGAVLSDRIVLETQMRVKGGKSYLDYIADIVYGGNPKPLSFEDYEFVLHEDFDSFHSCFESSISEHSLTRMIAGYAWKWVTGGRKKNILKGPDAFDIEIDDVKLKWNSCYTNWVGKGFNNPAIAREVGCIHSIQGFDLSYAYVILGEDIKYNDKTGEIYVVRENYFDTNGKNKTTDEELDQFIKNIYYVLLTRGIYGTHVYICDPALRKHLAKFFPTVI